MPRPKTYTLTAMIADYKATSRWRRLVVQLAVVDDRTLRTVGLISMLSGVGLLFLVT